MTNDHILEHKHLIVSAAVRKTFDSTDHLKGWFRRMIEGIGMVVAELPDGQQNPVAFYCNDVGNTGYTGTAIITTSNAALHMWDAVYPHKVEFDLYSCSCFSPEEIFPYFEELDVVKLDYKFIDRATGTLIEERTGKKTFK